MCVFNAIVKTNQNFVTCIAARQAPFSINFNSDNWEYVAAAIGAATDEAAQTTSGFSLRYTQQNCAATTTG